MGKEREWWLYLNLDARLSRGRRWSGLGRERALTGSTSRGRQGTFGMYFFQHKKEGRNGKPHFLKQGRKELGATTKEERILKKLN